MTRLLRVELRRYAARRLVRLLLAALLAILGTILVVNAVQHSTDIAAARAKAERQFRQVEQPPPEAVRECEQQAEQQGQTPEEFHCRPTAADFFQDPRFVYVNQVVPFANAGVGLGVAVTVILAVGFIGAEWGAGTFAALLLWEPRRLRVLAAKLGAATVAAVVVAAVAVAILVAGAWLLGATRGTTSGRVSSATYEAAMHGLRGLGVAALLPLVFGSLAVLVRSTAGVLGILALYTIGAENVLRALKPQWSRWELGPNVAALIAGRLPLDNGQPRMAPGDDFAMAPAQFTLHADRAALQLAVLAAVMVALAAVLLRRRDVT